MAEKEKEYSKIDAKIIWANYENSRNYKSSQGLYDITRRNEQFYAGEQYDSRDGSKYKEKEKPVFNFIEQLTDVKVSTIMANEMTINRRPDEMDETEEGQESKYEFFANAFTEMDKKNWDRNKMEQLSEEMLLKCSFAGLGGTYWFWDDNIKTGNEFVVQGDFKGETIDGVDLYVSNPQDEKIQTQDWIMLSKRMTVKQAKKMAEKYDVPDFEIEAITGDEDTTYEAYEKAETEQDNKKGSSNVTVLLKMWKEKDEEAGITNVYFVYASKGICFNKEPINSGLTLYPVAMMNWKNRQKYIYGTGEATSIIGNQQSANILAGLRTASARLASIPKWVYNKNNIQGITDMPGGSFGLDLPSNSPVTGMLMAVQPASTSIDFDKALSDNINLTKELKGINDNVLGVARAENTSAIIAQQKAAGVPLQSILRRYKQYIEDVALIWLDFYQHKYDMVRKIKDDEGNVIKFTGTDAEDMYLKTVIDVGESANWSETIAIQVLDNWLAAGLLNKVQYYERFPKGIISDMDKLIEDSKKELGITDEEKPQENEMIAFINSLPEEVRAIINAQPNSTELLTDLMNRTPEEQQQLIAQLIESQQQSQLSGMRGGNIG